MVKSLRRDHFSHPTGHYLWKISARALPLRKSWVSPCRLDPILSWEKHISHVVQKCNGLLISLYRFRQHFSQDIATTKSDKHSCLSVHRLLPFSLGWGQQNLTFQDPESPSSDWDTTNGQDRPDTPGSGWQRVERLVEMKDAVKMHKLLTQELGPPAVRSMFVARSAVSHRSTRSTEAGRLELPWCRLVCTQHLFICLFACITNRDVLH